MAGQLRGPQLQGRALRVWLLLAATIAFATAAVVAWLWYAQGPQSAAGDPAATTIQASDKSLGINTDLANSEPDAREAELAAMEAAGLRWVRQRFPWDAIEPARGVFHWEPWDDIIEAAERHNIRIVALLDGSPAWARSAENADDRFAPPADVRDYGTFVAAFAARYQGRIGAYEIWDEPNIAPHWGVGWVDPAGYSRLLREGAIRIRSADLQATILLAALAPNVEPGGANMSEVKFLGALYAQGAAEWFDAVAVEPYDFDQPLDAAPQEGELNWARAALLRQVMQAHGDGAKAVWAVSFGWSSQNLGNAGVGGLAASVGAAVADARQNWTWLGPMLWAAWRPEDPHGQYALVSSAAQSTSILDAIRSIGLQPAIAWPGSYPPNHPSGQFEGNWTLSNAGADIGQSGDKLTIRFWGTRLDLTVRRGDYRAYLFVSVDGGPANALPQDEQDKAYVVLYDPLDEEASVTLAQGLPVAEHVAEIIADGGWGQWAIAGWTVLCQGTPRTAWPPAVLSVLTLVALGVMLTTGRPYRSSVSRQQGDDRAGELGRALPSLRQERLKAPSHRLQELSWDLLRALAQIARRAREVDARVALAVTGGVAVLLYLVVGTAPSLLVLVILAALLLLRPEAGLPLIALALPFNQPGKALLGKVFSMVEILTVLTAAGWVANQAVQAFLRRRGEAFSEAEAWSALSVRVRSMTGLDWAVTALAVVGLASLLWTENVQVAARELRTVILESAVFYALLRLTISRRADLWRVVDAWVFGGVLIAGIGIYQWAFGQNVITADGVWRVRGFYGSPNNLALYLGRLLPLGVVIAAWGRGGLRRVFYAAATLIMAATIFLTYSRGAWLLGVPASLLFLAAMRGRKVFLVVLIVLAVLAAVILLVVGPGRVTSLVDTSGGTTFLRLQLWRSSWSMVRDHPILGVGLDNFLYQYRTRYVLPTAWEEFNLSHPHNVVLDFWLRLGIPGLLLLVWLLVAFFRRGWRQYRGLPEGDDRLLVVGLLAGMVDFVAHGLVDNAFFLVDLAFVFMLMAAVVGGSVPLGVKATGGSNALSE